MCSIRTLDSINRAVVDGAMKYGSNALYKVFLYGSYARQDYDSESDIDYMVVMDGNSADMKKYFIKCITAIFHGTIYDGSIDTIQCSNTAVVDGAMKYGSNALYKVFLYGSYARQDYDSESDIDYMVVMDGNSADMKKLRREMLNVSEQISYDNDVVVSVLVRDKNTFETQKNILPLYKNILQEGVALYG